jgi:hypothetical protein
MGDMEFKKSFAALLLGSSLVEKWHQRLARFEYLNDPADRRSAAYFGRQLPMAKPLMDGLAAGISKRTKLLQCH